MLATKFASSSKAQTTHALRARISQRPERRSEEVREANGRNCAPGSDLIVVLLFSRREQSLRQQEDCTYSGTIVCALSPRSYHAAVSRSLRKASRTARVLGVNANSVLAERQACSW